MNINEIRNELFRNQDEKYRNFQAKLLPTLGPQTVIGVRTPILRVLAKTLYQENDFSDFLNDLPHEYFDENQLHAFLISEIKDFDSCMDELNKFLPFWKTKALRNGRTTRQFRRLWRVIEFPMSKRSICGL